MAGLRTDKTLALRGKAHDRLVVGDPRWIFRRFDCVRIV